MINMNTNPKKLQLNDRVYRIAGGEVEILEVTRIDGNEAYLKSCDHSYPEFPLDLDCYYNGDTSFKPSHFNI